MTQKLLRQSVLDVIENVADIGGWLINYSTGELFWTQKTREIHEVPDDWQLNVEKALEFYLPEFQPIVTELVNNALAKGEAYSFKAQIKTYTGNIKWVYVYGKIKHSETGQVELVYGAFQDITQSMEELTQVNEQRLMLETILDNILEGLIVIDQKGVVQSFNVAAERIFGYAAKQVIGNNIKMLMPNPDRARHDSYIHNYKKTHQAKIIGIGRDVEGQKIDGSTFPMALSIAEIEFKGEKRFLGTVRDLSLERQNAERIEWLSHYDEKTGLPNRNFLLNYLNETQFDCCVAIVTLNIDFFSRIFLAYGIEKSDGFIQQFSNRLVRFCGAEDFICRDMADRFWIVMSGSCWCGNQKVTEFVEQLCTELERPFDVEGSEHFVTTSVGVALSESNASLLPLLSQAELALHESRRRGRGLYTISEGVYSNQKILENYQLERRLREAIEYDRIECWLQPKVDQQHQLCSAEVLVRWRDKNDGSIIMPDTFIPIAESSGMMDALGEVIKHQTAKMLSEIHGHNAQLTLAMNVSPIQFLKEDFTDNLVTIFKQYDAPLSNLIVEITENLLIEEAQQVNQKIVLLTELGVKFSIDDFGTGYSNLLRIQKMPISELKIDKSFTWQCGDSGQGNALVKAIIAMAKSLNFAVVAEGVETQQHAEQLIALGADYLQGYYFNRPMEFFAFKQQYL